MQEVLLKIRYIEIRLSKSLKKVNFIFLSNPVPFNGQCYQKQKESGSSYQCLFRSWNKFRKIPSDQVWWCNVKQFLSYSKNYICKFMHVNSWHHKLFHFHLNLGCAEKKLKNNKKLKSRKRKELSRWNKNFLVVSKGLIQYHLVKK